MAVAVVRRPVCTGRLATTLLLAGAALASVGAAPAEEQEMLRAISDALTAMAYAFLAPAPDVEQVICRTGISQQFR